MTGMMRLLVLFAAFGVTTAAIAVPVQLKLDSSEADAALTILRKESASKPVTTEDWSTLFATEPYKRLKMRETSVGGDFTDEAFKAFLSNPQLVARTESLSRTLEAWKHSDLTALGQGGLAYLPEGAQIHAAVYPEIKPGPNSFVWGLRKRPSNLSLSESITQPGAIRKQSCRRVAPHWH